MVDQGSHPRDLRLLVVPRVGRLAETGEVWTPYQLLDGAGDPVAAVAGYLRDLQACGRPAATQRSYGMDLLRWFRFLWAVGVAWDRAGRVEARDFSLWFQGSAKPSRGAEASAGAGSVPRAGVVNAVTGKPSVGSGYAPRTVVHSETVLRLFYDFHREVGTGPLLNPFPVHRHGGADRAGSHRSPMDGPSLVRVGRYRPKVARRVPRDIPDELFDELFARLPSHRDRALVAFFVSSGARASELIGVRQQDVDPGRQVISVVRKGTRAVQQIPASADAFVWLRLYQEQFHGLIPSERGEPLWWTVRPAYRPLTYHAAHRMFERVNDQLGANWRLHDLRHTAAYRMARDPLMALTDVQWVLSHARLTTTQLYLTPRADEVIARTAEHFARRASGQKAPPAPPAAGYRPEPLSVLVGRDS